MLGGGIPCDGTVYTRTVRVVIDPDAPPGPQNFTMEATGAGGVVCSTGGLVTAVELTLSEAPAAYLPTNSNTVQFTATISSASMTDQIRFELLDASDFPGDAMNHGTQPDTDPDFKFDPAGNPDFTVESNQLVATTNSAVNSATVTVTAYDYGARARIKATLVNLGCESEERRLPRDTDDDWLPDAYENAQQGKDPNLGDTDSDGTPDGQEDDDPDRAVVANAGPNSHPGARSDQGLVGDGLVAFEEYRGFFAMGTHTRTTTGTKDVFAGVDAAPPNDVFVGLGFFANLTGFQVREIEVVGPGAIEWQSRNTRFVNHLRSGIPGASDQRALRVARNDTLQDGSGNPLFGVTNPI